MARQNEQQSDPRIDAYQKDLDAKIDALEAQLGEARQERGALQRVLDTIEGGARSSGRGALPLIDAAGRGARLAGTKMPTGGRRWALGAAAAAVAVGAGLTFAGGNSAPELPNAISLRDRVSVAEAADAPASQINVVPAPLFTLDASDSPFDDQPVVGGGIGGDDASQASLTFDSPDDSISAPANAAPFAPGDESASDSPDGTFVAPRAPAGAPFAADTASASASPDRSRSFQMGSPDSASASFDSPDNT